MTKPNRRHVIPHEKGWAVQKPGASRASSVEPTQRQAIDRAREILSNDGGGELTIHDQEGRIRDSDTVTAREPGAKGSVLSGLGTAIGDGIDKLGAIVAPSKGSKAKR